MCQDIIRFVWLPLLQQLAFSTADNALFSTFLVSHITEYLQYPQACNLSREALAIFFKKATKQSNATCCCLMHFSISEYSSDLASLYPLPFKSLHSLNPL